MENSTDIGHAGGLDAPSAILATLSAVRRKIENDAGEVLALWRPFLDRGEFIPSVTNLANYLAFRKADIRPLQSELSALGLSSLAHVPVVWATQVLDSLVKEGKASRAETTDAAMGQRAECVMLNKGPHLVEAVAFLDRILRKMDRHQTKKSAQIGPLQSWQDSQNLA